MAASVTVVMHARVPSAEAYARAFAADGARVVRGSGDGAPADFICSTCGLSVAFLVSPGGALAPEAAARAAKMAAGFRASFVVHLGAPLPASAWASTPPRPSWLALCGDAGDAARAMLALARALAAAPPAERPPPPLPNAAALVAAVAALPGVPGPAEATALLCASSTLADLACAPPHALAAVARLTPAAADALAATFQRPSPLVLPAGVAYAVV
jgi:hypothetical protein